MSAVDFVCHGACNTQVLDWTLVAMFWQRSPRKSLPHLPTALIFTVGASTKYMVTSTDPIRESSLRWVLAFLNARHCLALTAEAAPVVTVSNPISLADRVTFLKFPLNFTSVDLHCCRSNSPNAAACSGNDVTSAAAGFSAARAAAAAVAASGLLHRWNSGSCRVFRVNLYCLASIAAEELQ